MLPCCYEPCGNGEPWIAAYPANPAPRTVALREKQLISAANHRCTRRTTRSLNRNMAAMLPALGYELTVASGDGAHAK